MDTPSHQVSLELDMALARGISVQPRCSCQVVESGARDNSNPMTRPNSEMTLLTPASTAELLERFCSCNDGVLRSISYVASYAFFTRRAPPEHPPVDTVEWLLSVKDLKAKGGWSNLRLRVSGLAEFRFHQPTKDSIVSVISDGLRIGWFEDLVFLDVFSRYHEAESPDDFRESRCYVAGKECRWQVEAYDR